MTRIQNKLRSILGMRTRKQRAVDRNSRRWTTFELLERREVLAAFTVTINRFLAIDNPDGDFDDGDYYAVVRIGNNPAQTTEEVTGVDIHPNWTFTQDIPITQSEVTVNIQIWDEDDFLRFGDDQMDINATRAGAGDVQITVNRATGAYTGDATSPGPWTPDAASFGNGDGGLDRGRLFFSIDTDGDGDGLMNSWETQGIDANGDGVIDLNLAALGANPLHKDLFVEADSMQNMQPKPMAPITRITNATPMILTANGHGLTTGQQITIAGAPANTNANGTWTVTRLDVNRFSLDTSVGAIACFGGVPCGAFTLPAVTNANLSTNTDLDLVVDAFLKAPVQNPDGATGINLHINVDEQNLPYQSWDRDADGDGFWPYGEDLNGNGVFDVNEIDVLGDGFDPSDDLNGDGVQQLPYEDLNNNGVLDPGEDRDGNGCLNTPEDANANCRLDGPEDKNGNFLLDLAEDLNGNGVLDPGEDVNSNGVLDPSEDVNSNGLLDFGEDHNGNAFLDPVEDLNGNGTFDNGDTDDQGAYSMFRPFKQLYFGSPAQRTGPNAAQVLLAKRMAYRYMVFAGFRVDLDNDGIGVNTGSSGIQWGNSDANFIVTVGNYNPIGGSQEAQATTFMHEFGHALTLGHGGSNGVNYKPNYHSIMNYNWQFSTPTFDASWGMIYSNGTFPSLNEAALDETVGIGGHANHQTQFSTFNAAGVLTTVVINETGPVDWNNDGDSTDTTICPTPPLPPPAPVCVNPDINRNLGPVSPNETLTDSNDWAQIKYGLGTEGISDPAKGENASDDHISYASFIASQQFTLAGNALNGAATPAADGTLTLFLGPYASLRRVQFNQTNEQFLVEHIAGSPIAAGGETVRVSAFGYVQEFKGVKRIYASGGTGNDTIILGETVLAPAELHGGVGEDYLQGGAGADSIFGEAGNDVILAGRGVGDRLTGGDGDDRITGSDDGSDIDPNFADAIYFGDVIDAGIGNDTVFGMGGADYIDAGVGEDWVDSGAGRDAVHGGDGDDYLYAGHGLGDLLYGEAGADTVYGSDEGSDTITGGAGDDRLYGQGGADNLDGETGNDFLDGGTGADSLTGNDGDDEVLGGGGAGDSIDGGAGDDILRGSDDGADSIVGGLGRNRVYGGGGNDVIVGGPDEDIVDGGAGDDSISGFGGADLLIGGAGHDVIYGHQASAAGDDHAVDYLYGDFGTGAGEAGSGGDRLFGQGGNDFLFGEAGDDFIDATAGDFVDYGAGETAIPSDYVTPTPTAPPALVPRTGITQSAATLPNGATSRGRWSEISGSAIVGGLSDSIGMGIEPSLIVAADGSQYAAWVDNRHGNYEVYVARNTGAAWQELATSASGGGVSNTAGSSRRPSIILGADGQPIIVWTEYTGAGSDIRAARFDAAANAGAGAWVALGTSLGAGGLSATGNADAAQIVLTTAGPVVAWVDASSGTPNVYVKRFSGGAWSPLGSGTPASGTGVSALAAATGGARDLALATDGTKVAVAWTVGFPGEVQLREYTGTTWNAVGSSTATTGISATPGDSFAPALAYFQGRLFAAWQETVQNAVVSSVQHAEVYAASFVSGAWQRLNDFGNVSVSNGRAVAPQLSVGGNQLFLSWADLWRDGRPNQESNEEGEIFVRRWDGTSFQTIAGATPTEGAARVSNGLTTVRLAVDGAAHPYVMWNENRAERSATSPAVSSQIFLRGDRSSITRTFVADSTHPVQSILDANNLGPSDVIFIYGAVAGFTLGGDDAGVILAGVPASIQNEAIVSPRITGAVTINVADVTIESLDISGVVSVSAARFTAREVAFTAGLNLTAATDAQILSSRVAGTGLSFGGASDRATIVDSTLAGDVGVKFAAGGASNVVIRDNHIAGTVGIEIQSASGGVIADNDIAATATGVRIGAPFAGSIESNEIRNAATGVKYEAAATLSKNRVHHNATGVMSTVAGAVDALGFVGASLPNEIYSNTTGVQLTGQMQNQHVYLNTTGVSGAGVLGGNDLDNTNLIERNALGVSFTGPIQFNRITGNATGISALSGQLIVHNTIYGNSAYAIRTAGAQDVRIIQNTLITDAGDLIRVDGASKNIEIRNNILSSAGGFDIFVANDSQTGFFSDYNDLYASGAGSLVSWSGLTYTDILDWQADLAQFDLHSIGRTVVNPRWAEPRFVSKAQNDLSIFAIAAGQRFSSPTIDAGDPLADRGLPTGNVNLLTNGSFESQLAGWTVNPAATSNAAATAPYDGTRYFSGGASASGFAEQTIQLLSAGFTAAQLDAQDLVVDFGGRVRSASESPLDFGQLTLQFFNGTGTLLHTETLAAANTTDRWELLGGRTQVPLGARSVVLRFESVRLSGSTNDSYLDGAFVRVNPATSAPDLGAYGNNAGDMPGPASVTPHIALRSPDLYADLQRDQIVTIRWESFGNTAELPVRITLYQDGPEGPALLSTIAATAADTGAFDWIPGTSSVPFGARGLRIQVQLVGSGVAVDRSAEPFTVPENTVDYYVNDRDGSPTAGSNRNSGKTPSSPKPSVGNVLRIYTVTSGNTVHVDAGDYPLIAPLVISNIAGLGDDEGFILAGPTAPGAVALFHHANPSFTSAPVIDLNDADFMTINHISTDGGTYGLYVHNSSENFVGDYITVSHASSDGLRLQAAIIGSTLDHIVASANGGSGVVIDGTVNRVFDSEFAFNQGHGLRLEHGVASAITVKLQGNFAHDNRASGISTSFDGSLIIGESDLTLGRGNIVRDNAGYGIEAYNASTQIVGNTVSGQRTAGRTGVYAYGPIIKNVIFDNYAGIDGASASILNNRIYNNSAVGITVGYGSLVSGNVIYNNGTDLKPELGIGIDVFGTGTIANNVIYGNTAIGIRARGGAEIVNNTVYQLKGDAVQVGATVANLRLRNNILSTAEGFVISVPANSQNGFQSDYNLLYATGSGQIGSWQGAGRATLNAWRNASFTDGNSLSQAPLFVDLTDFHEQSLYGSFHGASLAPVRNAATGLPQFLVGALVVDAAQSPAIDRGLAADSFANETAPNGGFINLGAYGNTALASRSPAQYALVTSPDGGEIWPAGQTFSIRWRSHDTAGNAKLELLDEAGAVSQTIVGSTPNDGEFAWSIPPGFTPGSYRVKVTRLDAGSQADASNGLFSIPAPVHLYYVNDGAVDAGDWTTAPGNDANDGLSPAAPKASIRALLDAYDLGPGDTIRVDAGTYNLTTNIQITPDDSGVKIEGFHTTALDSDADAFGDNRSLKAVLNRGNTASGSYIFQFAGADDVTISHLGMTGAEYAIVAVAGVDSDGITIESNEIYYNYRGGVAFDTSNENQRVVGNRIFGSLDGSGVGISLNATSGPVVSNNSVFNMYYGTGIDVRIAYNATAPGLISDNRAFYLTYAINGNSSSSTMGITVSGNDVHDTRFYGIQGNALATITGNSVHDNPTGISAVNVFNNVVFSNQTGIDVGGTGSIAQGNRVYNNSVVGIVGGYSTIKSNTIYSNNVGVRLSGATQLTNNLIYDNANDGVWVWRDAGAVIENNTIYQNGGGDAIQFGGQHPEFFITTFSSTQTRVVNNILHVEQGYAYNFSADSGVGSTLDYNDLHVVGAGKLARWQNRDFTDVADWFYELGFDQHSQTANPQLANPAGADGVMGYRETEVGAPQIIDNGDPGFSANSTWSPVAQADGFGGDFLENSGSGSATWTHVGSVGYPSAPALMVDVPVSAFWKAHPGLGTANYTFSAVATYTVTYNNGSGPFNSPQSTNFSGAVASIAQATAGDGWHALGTLHLTFPNLFAQNGFVSVSAVTLTTTLRLSSSAEVIADASMVLSSTVDDGDAAFNKESPVWVQPGRAADYHVRPASSDQGAATWEFTGLTPGASYSIAALWNVIVGNSNAAAFTIFDGDNAVRWAYRDLNVAPNDFADPLGVKWNRLGTIKVTGDRLRVKLEGAGKLQADAVRIQQLIGDRAADDDFHVAANSPTIDAGSPVSVFNAEPAPNGSRINLGHTGNTVQATTSPAQFVQVLAPNGREKLEQGQTVNIQWRQSGIPSTYVPNAVLADNPAIYYRLDETTGTTATDASANNRNGVYTGGVTLGVAGPLPIDPVNRGAKFDGSDDFIDVPSTAGLTPAAITLEAWINPDPTIGNYATVAMKTTNSGWTDGYGMYWYNGKLRFFVNNYGNGFVEASVPTGAWSHVAGTYDGAMLRLFVNGSLIASTGYTTPVSTNAQPLQIGRGQGGYLWKGMIDEFALFGAALTGGQIAQHMTRQDFGAAKIELENTSTHATTIINPATPNDADFTWTIPAAITPGPYIVRVTASVGILPNDASDASFLITSAGHDYYVNDNATTGDAFTTAIGSNANDGRSPSAPMASLAALLAAYDLDAGDVIHVDTGLYTSLSNIVLDTSDSGVRIEGPGAIGAAGVAKLMRGNTVTGSYAIQLTGADDVTLDWLDLSGGEYGVVATDYTDSERLTITNSQLHDNAGQGIYIGVGNDFSRIEHNTVNANSRGGIYVNNNLGTTIRTNIVHHNSNPGFGGTGISVTSASGATTSIVSGNESYNQDVGIGANGNSPIQITGNSVHHNYSGIGVSNNVVVSGNESFFNQGYHWSIGYGISSTNATVLDNVAHDNDRGIDASGSLVRGNRIYKNRDTGVQASGSNTITGNTIYASALGIRLTGNDKILNNVIYQNSNDAIWTWGSNGARIENNTIFAATGDAIQVGGPHADQAVTTFSTSNLTIKNNIFRVAQGYAINVAADSELGFASDYNDFVLTDSGKLGRWEDREFTSVSDWIYEIGVDSHSLAVDPQFIDVDGADNVLGYDSAANVDRGLDDNFRTPSTSRTVDAGDPRSAANGEPSPNGGRVNLGHTGNTSQAATSAAQLLQILSPNGAEKYESGQSVNIQWHAEGLTQSRAVALIDASGVGAGSWSANVYQTAGSAYSFATPVSLSGVTNPAPAATYQDGTYGGFGVGNRLAYDIPAADGAYTIRLHFVEPTLGAGNRVFDIKLNGVTVRSGFDIFAAAGGQFKATTLSFPVNATGGAGISLEMVAPSNTYGAFVTGIEVTAANPAGVANPTVNLVLSTNGGSSWTPIASGLTMDQYGQGSYQWTAGPETAGATALIGIASTNFPTVQDTSDAPFLIANAGTNYYVNDGATTGDVFATAIGNNANSGKSPSAPMSSLRALLAAYDLDAGDVVHVDAGTYRVYRNLTLGDGQSGVRIEGPGALSAGQAAAAVINRGSSASGSYVFELGGADDVTLDHLAVTGGTVGVYAPANVQSNRLTLSSSDLYANVGSGAWNVYIGASNADFTIRGSKVHSNSDGSAGGVYAEAARAKIENNDVFGNTTGISTSYGGDVADRIVVSGNQVHGNSSTGIYAGNQVLVTGNTVYDQLVSNAIGIYTNANSFSTVAANNVVYSNSIGVYASSGNGVIEYIQNNRVFNNTIGMRVIGNSQVLNNQIYSNNIGINTDTNYGFNGRIANNVIYGNLNQGILFNRASASGEVLNNTIYQAVGEAIRLESVTAPLAIRNNILEIDSGYAIYATPNSQANVTSDYNLVHLSVDPNAHVGFWGSATRHTLADWTAATSQDAHSLVADPLFVDRDGADNGLGYTTVDRGVDDNFNLRAGSPAIDRGDRWGAVDIDIDGLPRRDDPGTANAGRNDYAATVLPTNQFAATGVAQNWRSNNTSATYTLPFAFPFYDATYTTVYVSTEGFLQFGSSSATGDGANSTAKLRTNRRIAPLWDNLRTDAAGDDIFLDTTTAGQITFRWNATNEADSTDVQFAVTLFNDGRIRYDYGPGANLTPTVGLSMGNDRVFALLAGYDAAATLVGAKSVMWQLAPSFADIGAYEFRGSSLDTLAPTITATTPAQVFGSGTTTSAPTSIRVTFSEEINPIDARATSNYELRNPGPGGVYGDANDLVIAVSPQYAIGTNYVDLNLPAGALADGQYRLTIRSNSAASIHDLAGLQMDGDANATAGGDFVRTFTVTSTPALFGDLNNDHRVSLLDVMMLQRNFGVASGATPAIGDLNGDGAVNRKDVALMLHAYGNTASGGAPAAADAVVATLAADRVRTASAARITARPSARRATVDPTAATVAATDAPPLIASRRRAVAVDSVLASELPASQSNGGITVSRIRRVAL